MLFDGIIPKIKSLGGNILLPPTPTFNSNSQLLFLVAETADMASDSRLSSPPACSLAVALHAPHLCGRQSESSAANCSMSTSIKPLYILSRSGVCVASLCKPRSRPIVARPNEMQHSVDAGRKAGGADNRVLSANSATSATTTHHHKMDSPPPCRSTSDLDLGLRLRFHGNRAWTPSQLSKHHRTGFHTPP